MTASPPDAASSRPHDVAIVGNDLLVRALPAQAVQVAHAVAACGYALVVPVSWGEELIAEQVVRAMADAPGPRVVCCCPRVRARLDSPGHELAPHLLSFVAPPVAAARLLREHWHGPVRITWIGACEGAQDPAIDVRIHPADFLRNLAERGIDVLRQPTTFRDVLPPDRRRYWSLPGGAPAPEALRAHARDVELGVLDGPDLAHTMVDIILRREPVLMDVAQPFGCACAGSVTVDGLARSRQTVVALEPPRALSPVLENGVSEPLEYPPPAPVIAPLPEPTVQIATPEVTPAVEDAVVTAPVAQAVVESPAVAPVAPATVAAPSTASPHPRRAPPLAITPPGVAARADEALAAQHAEPVPPPPADQPIDATARPGADDVAPSSIEPPHPERRRSRWPRRLGASTRVTPTDGPAVPRAYAALRATSGIDAPSASSPTEVPDGTSIVEVITAEVVKIDDPPQAEDPGTHVVVEAVEPSPVSAPIAHPPVATFHVGHPPVVTPGTHPVAPVPRRGANQRRVEPPGRSTRRQLWALLVTLALLFAIGMLLVAVAGG